MQVLEGKSIEEYLMGFKTEATKETYLKKLRQFLAYYKLAPDELLALAKKDPKTVEKMILRYAHARRDEVSGSTLRGMRESLKQFLLMNDIENGINWEKISKVLPHAKKVGSDRSPTLEEVRQILDNSDLRMKLIVLISCSSGIRVGAFDSLKWRDVQPVEEEGNRFAKLTIYRNEPEQYTTFITPEASHILEEYRKRREEVGEKITPESPLIRDIWDSKRRVDPAIATAISSKSIKNLMLRLLWNIGLRKEHKRIQEFKTVHGFRKYFETNAKRILRGEDVERLKGHLSNYYKPSDEYLAKEYVKAIPYLTISEAVELKGRLEIASKERNEKIGELERENISLRRELEGIKEQLKLQT
ncbi:MAG: site-specific integrase, partial [Thaumarchaeota archaeon]|nr:site-specific integrase [Nitrososphaerota archaeon]